MRYKHGKVLFSYEDSFDNSVLSNLIHDWLVNFQRVLIERDAKGDTLGVPVTVLPLREDGSFDDKDLKKGLSLWLAELDEMIFAFSDYEPEYTEGFVKGEYFIEPTDPEEWDRYKDECDTVEQRKEAGRRLFADRFESLWW